MGAEIDRFRSVLGPSRSARVVAILAGLRVLTTSGPDVAEALANALVIHALNQPDPFACAEAVVGHLNQSIRMFLLMRSEASVKS
jgi:hypothetical protein